MQDQLGFVPTLLLTDEVEGHTRRCHESGLSGPPARPKGTTSAVHVPPRGVA